MIFWVNPKPLGPPLTGNLSEEDFLSPLDSCLIKEDPGTKLYRLEFQGGAALHKLYSYDNLFLKLRARLFQSRARREFEILRALAARNIPTLTPLCYGEENRDIRRLHSFLVTALLENVETLEARIQAKPERNRRLETLDTIARSVRAMHQAGFCHGTLFPRNILLCPQDTFEPKIFDAPFGRFVKRPLTRTERANDLVCLLRFTDPCVTRAEKARFLRVYLGRSPGTGWGKEGKRLAEAIFQSSAFTRSVRRKILFRWSRLLGKRD